MQFRGYSLSWGKPMQGITTLVLEDKTTKIPRGPRDLQLVEIVTAKLMSKGGAALIYTSWGQGIGQGGGRGRESTNELLEDKPSFSLM